MEISTVNHFVFTLHMGQPISHTHTKSSDSNIVTISDFLTNCPVS